MYSNPPLPLQFAVLYGTVHYFSTVHTQPLDPLWLMDWSQRFSFSSWNFNFSLIAPPELASFDKSARCYGGAFYLAPAANVVTVPPSEFSCSLSAPLASSIRVPR